MRRTLQPATALSVRELEVLALVADGLSNEAIGRRLFLSRATVKSHLVHVFAKLEGRAGQPPWQRPASSE